VQQTDGFLLFLRGIGLKGISLYPKGFLQHYLKLMVVEKSVFVGNRSVQATIYMCSL